MTRFLLALALLLAASSVHAAGWLFPKGPGRYGPYTGGHGYSYNVAYSYGFAWSAADTWRRDIFAYPGGINPYRPFGRPISKTVFPHPDYPYISVPGDDGLPTLIHPLLPMDGMPEMTVLQPSTAQAGPTVSPHLLPVPDATAKGATIRVQAPADAEVWVEKEPLTGKADERAFQTPALTPGKTQIYTLRAKWTEAGKEIERFRVVGVKAGETAKVTFIEP